MNLKDMPIEKQFSLLTAVEHPSMTYVDKAYIRADGDFFFHPGQPHTYKQTLDRNNPEDAKMILAGVKERTIKCEGTYIGASPRTNDTKKKIVLVLTFDEIKADRKRIISEYIPVLKTQKKKQNLSGNPTPGIDVQIDALEESLHE